MTPSQVLNLLAPPVECLNFLHEASFLCFSLHRFYASTVSQRRRSTHEKKLTLSFSLFLQFSPAGELLHRLSRFFVLLTQQHLTNIQKTPFHSPQTLFGLTGSFWVAHSLYSHLLSACFSKKCFIFGYLGLSPFILLGFCFVPRFSKSNHNFCISTFITRQGLRVRLHLVQTV